MSLGGAFANSVEALQAQSVAMGTISQNIANVNTTGYKTAVTNFETVLSESTANTNIFGVNPYTNNENDVQGNFQSTGIWDNLAINGPGFFVLNSSTTGSGTTSFSRAGNFQETVFPPGTDLSQPAAGTQAAYLTEDNGAYLMGYKASNGVVSPSDSLSALSAVNFTIGSTIAGQPTTQVSIQGSIPSNATGTVNAGVPIYAPITTTTTDPTTGVSTTSTSVQTETLQVNFTPNGADSWNVNFGVDPNLGTITQQPTTTVLAGTPPVPTTVAATINFDGAGNFTSTSAPLNVTIAWNGGTTSTITVDPTKMSQLASGSLILNADTQNGFASATMEKAEFDSQGNLYGDYSNGQKVLLYQVPVANFVAPNSLATQTGTQFTQTAAAGQMDIDPVSSLNDTSFTPGALETSNVDLGDQFTRMITTQTAYNSASKVFQTADQMTQTIRDLIT